MYCSRGGGQLLTSSALANYLPKSGGTMTGHLVINKAGAAQGSDDSHIVLQKSGTSYVHLRLTASNSNLAIESKGGIILYGGANDNGTAFSSENYVSVYSGSLRGNGTVDITGFRNATVTGDVSSAYSNVDNQFIIPASHSNGHGCGLYETKDITLLLGFLAADTGHSTLTVGSTSKAINLRGNGTRPTYNGNNILLSGDALTSVPAASTSTLGGIKLGIGSKSYYNSSSMLNEKYANVDASLRPFSPVTSISNTNVCGTLDQSNLLVFYTVCNATGVSVDIYAYNLYITLSTSGFTQQTLDNLAMGALNANIGLTYIDSDVLIFQSSPMLYIEDGNINGCRIMQGIYSMEGDSAWKPVTLFCSFYKNLNNNTVQFNFQDLCHTGIFNKIKINGSYLELYVTIHDYCHFYNLSQVKLSEDYIMGNISTKNLLKIANLKEIK